MRSLLLVVFVGLLVVSSSQAKASEINPKLRAKIEHLMELTGGKDLAKQINSLFIQQMVATMKQAEPEMSARAFDIVGEVVIEFVETQLETLVDLLIPLYVKYYSEEDIDALIAFHSTPTGRKMIKTMPTLMQETMQIVGKIWQERSPELEKKVRARLVSEGLVQ